MFIRFVFFSFVLISSAYAMENNIVLVREQLEEAFYAVTESDEALLNLATKLANLTGFRSSDEYKSAITKNGTIARCKKLTKRDKQQKFHYSPKDQESENNNGDDCV